MVDNTEPIAEPVTYDPQTPAPPTGNPVTPQEPDRPEDPDNPGYTDDTNYIAVNPSSCGGVIVAGNNPNWTPTSRYIAAGSTFRVTKTGGITLGGLHSIPNDPAAPPPCRRFNLALAIFPAGVTPVLNSSVQAGVQYLPWQPTAYGQEQVYTATTSGYLFLAFNDLYQTYSDNDGSYCVTVSVCAPPSVPTGLAVRTVANADCSIGLVLSWNAVDTATSYVVTRNNGGETREIVPDAGGILSTSATFTGAVSQSERFTVRTVNGCGSSGESAPVLFTPEVPVIPAPLVTLCQECCRKRVKIRASGVPNATAYLVERDGVPLDILLPGAALFDTAVEVGRSYTYTVRGQVGCFPGASASKTIRVRGWQTQNIVPSSWHAGNCCD